MKIWIPAPLALAFPLAAAGLAAPQCAPVPATGPVNYATYDLATQTWERVDEDGPQIAALVNEVVTIDNTGTSGFYLPAEGFEVVDYGRTVGSNGPACEIRWAYGTLEPDFIAGSGGPVSMVLSFYAGDGDTLGDCEQVAYSGSGKGELLARFQFDNLPGDSTPGDNIAESWFFSLNLRDVPGMDGFLVPEGGLAWGYEFLSDGFANGPLSSVPVSTSCGPPNLFPAPGTADCLDRYGSTASGNLCVSTFTYPQGGISSTYIGLVQEEFPAPVATLRFATPPNDGTLTPIVDKAVVGCEGATCPTVTVGGFTTIGPSVADFWALSLQSSPGLPLPGAGSVLIGLPWLEFLIGPAGASLNVGSIFPACDLVGLEVFTQGGAIDAAGAIALTNALDYVIGTP